MTAGEDIGVRFYLSFKDKIITVSTDKQKQLNVFMCARLSIFGLSAADLKAEEIEESERLILKQIYDPTDQRAELVSNMAEDEAMGTENAEDHCIRVAYWSAICYYFLYTKTHDSKFTTYTFSAYTGAVDDFLYDHLPEKLIAEEKNFASAYDVVTSVNDYDPESFIRWTKSVRPGERLPSFEV